MSLEPLTFLILLLFIAVVLAVLFVWFVLTLGARRSVPQPRVDPEPPAVQPVRPPQSNDLYRGAAVKPKERLKPQSDAFENFIRSTKDELDF